jgi:AcrR family transcriptional regulator
MFKAVRIPDTTASQISGRREKTREGLLNAGRQLLATRSLEGFSIDEVVELAGVAKGTFYNHFRDKDELAHEVYDRIRMRLEEMIKVANANVKDPAVRVSRGVCIYARYVLDEPEEAAVYAKVFVTDRGANEPVNSGAIADVASGLRRGRFRIPTVEAGTLMVSGVANALLLRLLHFPAGDMTAALTQQMLSVMLRGLGIGFEEALSIGATTADALLNVRTGREKAAPGLKSAI